MADPADPSDKPAPGPDAAQAALDEIRHLLNGACAGHSHMTAVLLAAGKAHKRAANALEGACNPSLHTSLSASSNRLKLPATIAASSALVTRASSPPIRSCAPSSKPGLST